MNPYFTRQAVNVIALFSTRVPAEQNAYVKQISTKKRLQLDALDRYGVDETFEEKESLIELMEYFEAKGIHVVSIQDKIDTTTAIHFGIPA